ncbi:putative molybdenum carrier protein [Methylophaga sp. OBS1]|uniref:putative molybdenum carrier protein n=1 Tax=Methylophaga sp. OBS1 TaxID=2991933 RepID=UPI00225C4009|nr:putative molybdenum carrier protein [Methylophaga sp. OBS1]MCX4192581.1 putative molybdenum carrier protein [Methylophaga sp. OBS1]
MTKSITVISGGQTGVDRGALDAALSLGAEIDGWCPKDGQAEDGPLDPRYVLKRHHSQGYRGRTVANVEDSDATIIIYWGEPKTGTRETLKICLKKNKPFKLIDAELVAPVKAAEVVYSFINAHRANRVNFAGPSAKKMPQGYKYSYELTAKLTHMTESFGV